MDKKEAIRKDLADEAAETEEFNDELFDGLDSTSE